MARADPRTKKLKPMEALLGAGYIRGARKAERTYKNKDKLFKQ